MFLFDYFAHCRMNHSSTRFLSFVQLAATAIFVAIGMSSGTNVVASTQMQNAFWWTPQAHNYATAFLTPIPLHVKLLSNASSNVATSSLASLQSGSNIMEFTMLDICTADAAESGICVACALSATNPASHKLLPTEAAGNFNDSSVNVSILSLLQCVALYGPKLCEGLANGILYSFNGLSSVVATNELSLLFPRFCDCSICRPALSNFNTTATFSDSELAISLLSTALASISDVSGYSLAGRPIIELAFSADIALNPNTLLSALTISEAVGQEVSDWTEAVFGAQPNSLAVWADYRTLLIALPTVPLPLSTSTDTILSALQDLPFSSLSFYGFPSLHPLPPSVLSVSQLSCSTSNYFLASSRLCVSCGVGAVSFGGLSPGCTCDAAHGYVGIWSAVPPYCQLSKDSSLQTLLVTGGVLSPPFATNAVRQMYTVLIANDGNLAVTAVAAAGANITLSTLGSIPPFNLTAMNDINGVLVPLVTGQTTTVSVNVLAADGIHQSMYFINATKESSTTAELALLVLLSLNVNCSLVSTDSALIAFKSELVNELSAFLQADISRFIIASLQCGSIDVTLAIQPGAPSSPSQLYGQLLAALYSGALANSTFTLLQRTTELQVLGFVAPVSAGNGGENGGGSGLSTQASIGIGVGVGVGGALLLLILLLLFCKFRNQIRSQTSVKDVKGEQMTTTGPELQKEGRANESGDEKRSPSPSVNVVKLHTETGVQLATIVVANNTSADSTARQTDGSK